MNYVDRINLLQKKIKELEWAGALLFYSRDVLYYTGTAQPSYLVVLPEDYFLFVKSGIDFARNDSSIPKEKIIEERRLGNIFKECFSDPQTRKIIGIELDVLTLKQSHEFRKNFPGYEFEDISLTVLEQRKTKDPFEIGRLKKACEVVDSGHTATLETLKEGVTELELSAAIENAHRLAGHEGIFFIRQPDFFMSRGPISSGPNLLKPSGVVYTITGVGLSPSVPAGPSKRVISKGDPVVVDIPTLVEGYHADQTRTYVLGGSNGKIKDMYKRLKEMADYLIDDIKPGLKCNDIYNMAIKKSDELKIEDAFLNFGKGKKGLMIGHGIGLELNEPPILAAYDKSEVSEGYVIALDMHLMDEKVGVVKLEDMILITNDGNEILNKTSRQLFEIPIA